ncbi:carbonic anhydrase [Humibacter ginsenosidimutans]|uniref:carbonic anhydrase n=1 Tax=Humibacter ginsenosidimutans TaxID=2599293 RepID=A0A5B8M2N5_9MICO|nr:carbonic anhydrase [Humibacter ginsenosidimutans]QDZ14411.1 carbonic anhydrase [Humibacter ginsenosidimutans]
MTNTSPARAWSQLQAGNARFIAGAPLHPHQDAERRAQTAGSQAPVATVFGCSDSRLAAEIIFDLGLGDAFVIRNAGQVISESVLGSIEYAVAVLHVPLLVVMSHDSCGAVRAAIDSAAPDADRLPPHIADLIAPIVPAVRRVAGDEVADPSTVDSSEVAREHVKDTISELLRRSELTAQAVADGELAIIGANYRLSDGTVTSHLVVGEV